MGDASGLPSGYGCGVGVGSGPGVGVDVGIVRVGNLGTLGVGVGVGVDFGSLPSGCCGWQAPGFVGCSPFTKTSVLPAQLLLTILSGIPNSASGISRYSCARVINAFHIGPAPAELKALLAMGVLSAFPIHTSTTRPSGPGV